MTLHGPDGSRWQDGMTFPTVPPDFMLWRASIGRKGDATYPRAAQWAFLNRVPFCAYHFVYERSHSTPAQQAQALHAAVADTAIPVMLDWEADTPAGQNPTFGDVVAVADAIRNLGYQVPLVYTGSGWWGAQGSPTMAGHGFELVNARYGNQRPTGVYECNQRYAEMGGDGGNGWDGYGGLEPSVWQFGSRIRWGDRYMDMNAVRDHACVPRCFQTWRLPPTPHPDPPEDEVTEADIEAIADRVLAKVLASADTHLGWKLAGKSWQTTIAGESTAVLLARAANKSIPAGATAEDIIDELGRELTD